MAVLWAISRPARVNELLELAETRGASIAYPTLRTHLQACVKKGWVRAKKAGRETYYEAIVDETTGVGELFEEFVSQFLEGRPAELTGVISDRLKIVTFGGENGKPRSRKAKTSPSIPQRVARQDRRLARLEHSLTHLEVEVQGLRAAAEAAPQDSAAKRPRRRRRQTG